MAIEFRSFSKNAGFTGTRCAFTVVPKDLQGVTSDGTKQAIHPLWNRRQSTKFNGVSYIIQRGAEAAYSETGRQQIGDLVGFYLENARLLREGSKPSASPSTAASTPRTSGSRHPARPAAGISSTNSLAKDTWLAHLAAGSAHPEKATSA